MKNNTLDWLKSNLQDGKYGFIRYTLDPDYDYFEFVFTDAEDAMMFGIMFKK